LGAFIISEPVMKHAHPLICLAALCKFVPIVKGERPNAQHEVRGLSVKSVKSEKIRGSFTSLTFPNNLSNQFAQGESLNH